MKTNTEAFSEKDNNKIIIHTFPGGKKAYSTPGISILINKTLPIKKEVLELDKKEKDKFFGNPDAFNLTVENKKVKIIGKKDVIIKERGSSSPK